MRTTILQLVLTAMVWTGAGGACTGFNSTESQAVLAALFAHQHPASCADVFFLEHHVLATPEGASPFGLGAQMRSLANSLAVALASDRVLVLSADSRWELAPQPANAALFGVLEPLTSCVNRAAHDAKPPTWWDFKKHAHEHRLPAARRQRVLHISETHGGAMVDKLTPTFFADRHKRWFWWRAHLLAFLFRPLPAMVAQVEQRRVQLGWPAPTDLHGRVLALHVRSGDRGKNRLGPFLAALESSERACDEWWEEDDAREADEAEAEDEEEDEDEEEEEEDGRLCAALAFGRSAPTLFLATDDVDNVALASEPDFIARHPRFEHVVVDRDEFRAKAVTAQVAWGEADATEALETAVRNVWLLRGADQVIGTGVIAHLTWSDFSLLGAALGCVAGASAEPLALVHGQLTTFDVTPSVVNDRRRKMARLTKGAGYDVCPAFASLVLVHMQQGQCSS